MSQQDDFVSPIDAQLAQPPMSANDTNAPLVAAAHDPVGYAQTGGGGTDKLIQNKLAVLACLFFVTGFLGLPLLWMNRRFSTAERFLWSIVVTLYTLALIAIVVVIFVWVYRQIAG